MSSWALVPRVGAVIPTRGAIIPAAVGVDIGWWPSFPRLAQNSTARWTVAVVGGLAVAAVCSVVVFGEGLLESEGAVIVDIYGRGPRSTGL